MPTQSSFIYRNIKIPDTLDSVLYHFIYVTLTPPIVSDEGGVPAPCLETLTDVHF